jgi:hypothetical protein
MDEIRKPKAYQMAADEKTSMVMAYTANALIRGQVITKESIRVSIWLRTQGAPEYIHMLNTHILTFGGGSIKQTSFPEFIIPTAKVLALHLNPPDHDPMDYDETEENRVMEPVTAMVGSFRFDGHFRLSTQTDAVTNLSVVRSPWMSMYHIEISNPYLGAMGTLKVPLALVRPQEVYFGMNVEAEPEVEETPVTEGVLVPEGAVGEPQ